jgi:predicted Zn finger-like uncharacterized protein
MNVTCPNCATTYRVDPAKVPEAGVRARCAVCSAVFAVNREPAPAPARTPEPVGAGAAPVPPPPVPAPMPPQPPVAAPAPAPRTEPPRSEPPRSEPSPVEPPRREPPRVEPQRAEPAPAPRMAPPQPQTARPVPPPPVQPAAPAATVRPAAPAKPVQTPPATPGTRPVNPFLSQDPSLKAKRLARALISDMVVYHPAKRQEGLRDGNLKELFDEEIKKSWEEYSDQVGRELAESTGYFREALNEILAGGRQIF